jgi:hypothetical protein
LCRLFSEIFKTTSNLSGFPPSSKFNENPYSFLPDDLFLQLSFSRGEAFLSPIKTRFFEKFPMFFRTFFDVKPMLLAKNDGFPF